MFKQLSVLSLLLLTSTPKAIALDEIASISSKRTLIASSTTRTHNASVNKTPVSLAHGHGVNLNFISETIQKVWLDNPTFAVLDFDGCLKGMQGCNESTATIVHLKRINDLKLKGIPYANSTLLTVITRDRQARIKQHFFQINKAQKPATTLINVSSVEPALTSNSVNNDPSLAKKVLADRLLTLVRFARENQKISPELKNRLIRFASLVEQGNNEALAARQAGISLELIDELIEID